MFVTFTVAAILLDLSLAYRMEYQIKTIGEVLGQDNPDAIIQLSLDVSTPMLFSSIQVNSFTSQVFHKAPLDEEGQK